MSSLFSLMPSAPGCDVLIVAGFKVEQLPLANLAQSASQGHQEITTNSAACVVRVESEHVFASSLQTFYHHSTHPLQKLVA